MSNIKRFFECLVPVTACNLKCHYCYIVQRGGRNMEITKLKYSVDTIRKALRQERLGGVCYFSLCGAGETLLGDQIVELVKALLENGHYVNITTNGTITEKIRQFETFFRDYLKRLHISFSLHYLELLRIKKVDEFFDNVHRIRNCGASFLVQLNLCDEYVPYLDEIQVLCKERIGAYPQIAATRKENDLEKDIQLFTEYTSEEYLQFGKQFGSPLFGFTMKNFGRKQNQFCYAGDWSGQLDFGSGLLKKCYVSTGGQYIFDDVDMPIKFSAIGVCRSPFCMNSSHFMSLGVVPTMYRDITYAGLRNRIEAGWYTSEMDRVLRSKLIESNCEYTWLKRSRIVISSYLERAVRKLKRVIRG